MIQVRHLLAVALAAATCASAAFLPYQERLYKYDADTGWEPALKAHWADWKLVFGGDGTIHGVDPAGNLALVSESQAQALMLSVWFGDSAFFRTTWSQTKIKFWHSTHFASRIGDQPDDDFSSVADQDILGSLIFASILQDSGYWPPSSPSYKEEALKVLRANSASGMVDANRIVVPGANAGEGALNPSHFTFNWYPVFADFAARNEINGIQWLQVRNACYTVLGAQPNSGKGMVRNWSNATGGTSNATVPSRPNRDAMGFEAVRVPWRVGLDAMWHRGTAALQWCRSVWEAGAVDPEKAGMYVVEVPALWGWTDGSYEKSMTEAMWGTCAAAVKDSTASASAAAGKLKASLAGKLVAKDFFTSGDSSARKDYVAQTLSLLGALAISGRAWNVWDDLIRPWTFDDTLVDMVHALEATPSSVSRGSSVRITAKFSRPVDWTLTLTGAPSGASYVVGPTRSASIDVSWTSGRSGDPLKPFREGDVVTATVSAGWTTPPAGSTTTLRVGSAGTAIRRGTGKALSWTGRGLLVEDGLVPAGTEVRVERRGLDGSRAGIERTARAVRTDRGILLEVEPARGGNAGIVELTTVSGDRFRVLVPPTR